MLGPVGLKRIIGFYSVKNTILRDVADYYINDNIIREITTFQTYHNYPIESFYLICFTMTIAFFFSSKDEIKKEKRLQKIKEYKISSRCVNVFLIIFTMIFTKNIENAI